MTQRPLAHLSVGTTYKDFKITKALDIQELQCRLIELEHLPTGAQVLHIANEDPENFFCLSFQTLPEKSDGVAHILEHTVLCGSNKFPVKDPFFAMQRRSLNTFMNALTGTDFTCYPAASQVPHDFYNLLDVYIDAVFRPKLDSLSFLQEGHRLEFANPFDKNSLLEHKGIVFNEMKGALSTPSARLGEFIHEALFPDTPYGVNSGGTPAIITELTYEGLKQFYQTFYHPSRCLFFFYGSLPLEGHLDFIAKHALEGVEKKDSLPPIPSQSRFSQPRRIQASYPIGAEENLKDKTWIGFGWLTCNILEQEELLALNILQIMLMSTDASPLKRALLRSGVCKSAVSHIDIDLQEVPWTITLSGCSPEDGSTAENTLRQALEDVVKQGIPLDLMTHAMHQLEFHRSEIRADNVPFGLSLFMRAALLKQHKARAEDGLISHTLFDKIHKRVLEDPNYFGKLIKKHLLDNPHFVRIVMVPDSELAGKELAAERAHLDAIRKKLTPIEEQELIHQARTLAEFQKKIENEDINVLPKVSLSDVTPSVRNYILNQERLGNLEVFHHATFTNQIVYADLVVPLPKLDLEEIPYLRLFADLLTQVGSGGRNYMQNLDYILAHVGDIGATLSFNLMARDHNQLKPTLNIRGKALHRQAHKLFPLIFDLATSVNFDDKTRLLELIRQYHNSLEHGTVRNSQRYAINLSAAHLTATGRLTNIWYGIEYLAMIREIAHEVGKDIDPLINKLKKLQQKIFASDATKLVVTSDQALYNEMKKTGFYGLANLSVKQHLPWEVNYAPLHIQDQGRTIASPVAFAGKVIPALSYVHPDAPALVVAAPLMNSLVLHKLLREQGGAYGGGAVSNSLAGNFYFYTYRDPNIIDSAAAFEEALNTIAEGHFSDAELQESLLEVIQGMDDPIKPGARGDYSFMWLYEGRTLEVRQEFRNRLLNMTKGQVINAVKTHLLPGFAQGRFVVFAGKELLVKENEKLEGAGKHPLKIYPV